MTAARIVSALLTLSVAGCTPAILPLSGTPNWHPDKAHAKELAAEEKSGNGIEVDAPKIYDDASLRMSLDATRAQLASLTGLNQGALTSSLGSINGATISQSQFGLQIGPGALPGGTSITNTGATTSTTTNGNLPQGNTSLPGSVTVTTDPTQASTVTTTVAPPTAPTVASGLAFTPPGSVSTASLDILNQELQLSSAITGYSLLLEGALSDRFVTNTRLVKPRVTLGFPITLRPPAAYKDAVAVVEVEATTSTEYVSQASFPEPPAITALLPREKTYNVAAMTDRTTSIGAGAIVGAVGIGASYSSGHKSLFLVQDQDTVALKRPRSRDVNTTGFMWEFRPVLGQRYVQGGLKETFVQLALPVLASKYCYGTVRIRTYWRRFDQDTGLVGDVIPESVLVSDKSFPIMRFDLAPVVEAIHYEDLGDGSLSVAVQGHYLDGTYVQFGSLRYERGKNLVVEDSGVKFVVPAAAVALWPGKIIARSGDETVLLTPAAQTALAQLSQTACIDEKKEPGKCAGAPVLPVVPRPRPCPEYGMDLHIGSLNETDSLLHFQLSTALGTDDLGKLLVSVGSKVLGLKDAPIRRGNNDAGSFLVAAVPTALLIASPSVRVFSPFWSASGDLYRCFDSTISISAGFGPDSAAEHLTLVSVDKSGDASYLLYGNELENARLLFPGRTDAALGVVDHISPSRIRLLTIKKAAIERTKKIVLQKADGEHLLVLEVPSIKASAAKAGLSVDSPVIQGTQELDVTADKAADVASIKLKEKALHWKSTDKSTIRLLTLKADGVTNEQGSKSITVVYKNGEKAALQFEVVAARVSVQVVSKKTNADADAASTP